ncbi:MAG: VWA domain-containing protein [Acidobacteriota bacterium]
MSIVEGLRELLHRRRAATTMVTLAVASLPLCLGAGQQLQHQERVEVARVVVDTRVIDAQGNPISGLVAADFRVEADGKPVRVTSVEWVSTAASAEHAWPTGDAQSPPQVFPLPGRLIVFFFQRDLHSSRMRGLMRIVPQIDLLLDSLTRGDRVAVLSFDSHLKLYADFTNDWRQLRELIRYSIVDYRPPVPADDGPDPSLAGHFDVERGNDAATPEEGLLVLAEALQPLPGAKTLILFGWGLGKMVSGEVITRHQYEPARRALMAARTTVFSLDFTQADYHSLQGPLRKIAVDTGGFYEKSFPINAAPFRRLIRAIAGHYVLVFEEPDLPRGRHTISVKLLGRSGRVLARHYYYD